MVDTTVAGRLLIRVTQRSRTPDSSVLQASIRANARYVLAPGALPRPRRWKVSVIGDTKLTCMFSGTAGDAADARLIDPPPRTAIPDTNRRQRSSRAAEARSRGLSQAMPE